LTANKLELAPCASNLAPKHGVRTQKAQVRPTVFWVLLYERGGKSTGVVAD